MGHTEEIARNCVKMVKNEICIFSGYKIYPGHGSRFIRSDSKMFVFLSQKCSRHFHMRHNPRRMRWTKLYRRLNKKGLAEATQKKRTRRTAKFQRSIVGASIESIRQRRSVRPEVRKQERKKEKKKNKTRAGARSAFKIPKNLRKSGRVN